MLSTERVTVYTQVVSDNKINLIPEFVFKGVGTRTKLQPPDGVKYQWDPKGSYRLDQMLRSIKNFPTHFSMFTQKDFGVYVHDDYTVHLMPELRHALFKRGYILIVIGGITGDVQINYTNYHHMLKSGYRDQELMLRQLAETLHKFPHRLRTR